VKKICFLVDVDNVSTEVIEQAFVATLADYGAVHVRRAYCTAEQAAQQQGFMKRLQLRPIVNLAIGKNSTDIALAADAMDLVISERPDVVVLVSSDSDYAPLVARLREKGAWLRGFGQQGKTGEGVPWAYDQFTDLSHSGGSAKPASRSAPAKKAASGRNTGRKAAPAPAPVAAPAPVPQAPPAPAPVVQAEAPKPIARPAQAAQPAKAPARGGRAAAKTTKAVAAPVDAGVAAAKEMHAILAVLPRLAAGHWLELNEAAQALRAAGLLAKTAPTTKLFRKHATAFELAPERQPNNVRLAQGG
jgi:predicted nuclease of predicted toxin-antitoxin system